ncbi:response regulator transcription factor [Bradyrhizobium aeschynomenes]|uniref:response regulator transcription factor n=1 Tax=Bradyrhizobium aeschynomenes TaxID=2734909 RepID=UPI00155813F9|nr:response regulator [Bradyrhizobium aeschynomenes]NPV19372.1 response regulator transcription factor [Bradyrhizobium aeschynomenes]
MSDEYRSQLRQNSHELAPDAVGVQAVVGLVELKPTIQRVLSRQIPSQTLDVRDSASTYGPIVFVVDDDAHVRDALRQMLENEGRSVRTYDSGEAFLAAYRAGATACLLIDAYLPGMSGTDLLGRLANAGHRLPAVMITGGSDIQTAVGAMKSGAMDVIEKPVGRDELIRCVDQALRRADSTRELTNKIANALRRLGHLTQRERQILERIVAGDPNKNIAADLGLSQRTVENHRASIMKKTGSKTLPALIWLVFATTADPDETDGLR